MGIDVELQDESGGVIDLVADPTNVLGRLLPRTTMAYTLLSEIDPYADTVFNGFQMERFLSEWVDVISKAETEEEKGLVLRIELPARRCKSEVHTYLKFVGD
jgi:hypothetical protein